MPRRQFVADFNVAVGETASWLGSGISLERGEDDGSFKFKLNLLAGGTFQSSIEVHALIAGKCLAAKLLRSPRSTMCRDRTNPCTRYRRLPYPAPVRLLVHVRKFSRADVEGSRGYFGV